MECKLPLDSVSAYRFHLESFTHHGACPSVWYFGTTEEDLQAFGAKLFQRTIDPCRLLL
jgi:hypothetical protein